MCIGGALRRSYPSHTGMTDKLEGSYSRSLWQMRLTEELGAGPSCCRMGPLRRQDLFPGEHRIRTNRIMPQTGFAPVRGFFFFPNVTKCMELLCSQFLEQLSCLDQVPYYESGFSFQFSFSNIPSQSPNIPYRSFQQTCYKN